MMQFLSDPEAIAKVSASLDTLVTALQEIRDAVILQNYISAIVADENNVSNTRNDILKWARADLARDRGGESPPET